MSKLPMTRTTCLPAGGLRSGRSTSRGELGPWWMGAVVLPEAPPGGGGGGAEPDARRSLPTVCCSRFLPRCPQEAGALPQPRGSGEQGSGARGQQRLGDGGPRCADGTREGAEQESTRLQGLRRPLRTSVTKLVEDGQCDRGCEDFLIF